MTFRAGVAAGLVVALAGAAAVTLWPEGPTPAFNIEVVSNGADVSQHGGVKVIVANERDALVQTCNGPCDDLNFRTNARGDTVYRVRVLDAAGGCVACDAGQYVTSGGPEARWTVSGKDKLTSTVSILHGPK